MTNSSFFTSKVYWITGAGTGYGKAIAIALSHLGATVIISSRRKEMLLTCKEEAQTNRIDIVPCDITQESSINTALEYIQQKYITIDGIIHAAALPPNPNMSFPLLDSSEKEMMSMLTTNTIAPYTITKKLLHTAMYSSNFRVIFISSEAGFSCSTLGSGIYNLSKTALNSIASSMALEVENKYPHADIQMYTLVADVAKSEMNPTSSNSPTQILDMIRKLLMQEKNSSNGKFFHSNGNNLYFLNKAKYEKVL